MKRELLSVTLLTVIVKRVVQEDNVDVLHMAVECYFTPDFISITLVLLALNVFRLYRAL